MNRPDRSRPGGHRPPGSRPSGHRMRVMTSAAPSTPPPELGKLFRVAGLPAVRALFSRDPGRVERLYYEDRVKTGAGEFCRVMAAERKPYRLSDAAEMERINGSVLHGGILALTRPKTVEAFDLESARRLAPGRKPILMLDGVGNPHNLGAIARTCAFFGIETLVLSDHPEQAGPSEAAWRVAEGGLEYVTLSRAVRFAGLLKRMRPFYHVIGTALAPDAKNLSDVKMDNRPLAIVLGNEESGLPAATLEACESLVTIRGSGQIQSLNVSATAAIVIHNIVRAQGP
ncbi:MAG: RNA methyltransferase [Pseudomonadota bacterium]|nr:RNA methyltransferase [Pseudomonadota bacterium]